jgi:hypothetical protein
MTTDEFNLSDLPEIVGKLREAGVLELVVDNIRLVLAPLPPASRVLATVNPDEDITENVVRKATDPYAKLGLKDFS